MTARRFFTALGVVAVATVAGAISYRHQQHLAISHGQPHPLSLIWPLCVDGLVTVTALAISTDRAAGYRPRVWALLGFWIGVTVSVATNWLATDGGLVNHGVSAFPALAFLLAVESLSSKPRALKVKAARPAVEPVPAAVLNVAPVDAVPTVPAVKAPTPKKPASSRRAPQTAAAKVAAAARKFPAATPEVIAAKTGVSDRTVRRHLAGMVPAPVDITTPANGTDVLADMAA